MQSIFLLKFVRFSVEISVPHRSAMTRKETIMKLNDFLKPELLGNKFVAVKGYTEVLDRETNKPVALRLNVSIQVVLSNLNIGQFNGNLWFSCSDVISAEK